MPRRSRYLRARLQLAHLPFLKNFDQFDFGFQPSIDERQIQELRSLRFIHEASNIVLRPRRAFWTTIESDNSAAAEPAAVKPKGGRKPTKEVRAQKMAARTKKTAGAKTDRANKKAEVIALVKRAKGARPGVPQWATVCGRP
jgi:IstB-like ATP binding protein